MYYNHPSYGVISEGVKYLPTIAQGARSLKRNIQTWDWYRRRFGGSRGSGYRRTRSVESRLRRLENRRGEWQILDKDNLAAVWDMDITGNISAMTNMAQGDADNERTGNLVYLQSVSLKFRITDNTSGSTDSKACRVILFFDTQQNGTKPLLTEVLSSSGSYMAHPDLTERGRFQIIYDKTFTLNHFDSSAGVQPGYTGSYYKKFGGRRIYYKGSGTTDANLSKGNLYQLVVSNYSGANPPKYEFTSRIRFTEA